MLIVLVEVVHVAHGQDAGVGAAFEGWESCVIGGRRTVGSVVDHECGG